MENKDIKDIEELEHIKIVEKQPEKKGNRLANEKQRKKKREKEKNKKGKVDKKKVIIIVLIAVVAFILILGSVIGTYIYKADGNITTAALNMAADVLGEDDPIFVLVLGVSEDISSSLTDTIILAGYNPDSQKAFMLSIPRDTFIGKNEATAGGYDKINALYQSGPKKTVEAVEKLTGIDIAHYVIVKNTALPAIVSAIGEVEFDVPIDMDYDDPTQNLHIHLKAGVQMIDGDEAEQLLRFRHNNDGSSYPTEYGDNDYGRMKTQREFIKTVVSQLISGYNMSNLKQIATAVFDNVTTDMSLTKILAYAPSAVKLNIDGIRMEQLPGVSDKINNLWFYRHDGVDTYDLINELLTELELDEKELKKWYTPTKRVRTKPSTQTNTIVTNETNSNQIKNEVDDEHEHSYTSKVTIKATCTGIGEEVFTCECGKTYTQEIPKKNHAIKTTTKTTETEKTIIKECTNDDCDYYDEEITKLKLEEDKKEEEETDKPVVDDKEDKEEPPATEQPEEPKEEEPKEEQEENLPIGTP